MMRCLVWTLALAGCGGIPCSRADFNWFNTTNGRVTYASGGTNFLLGSAGNPAAACFVQLIYAGTNNSRDVATDTGSGVSADDVVVSNLWVGARVTGDFGHVNGGLFQLGDVVGFYFVRLWTAPTPNFSAGTVPSSLTNFYGDSALFFNSCTGGLCLPDNFDFGGTGFATTLHAQFTDSDGDGLPDWWEILHFGGPTNAGAGIDQDVDGLSNFQEYTAGTDPTNAASVLELVAFESSSSPTGFVVRWSAVEGKAYDVVRGTSVDQLLTTIGTQVQAVAPFTSFTDTTAGAGTEFYGIGVR